mmetsp:Transcript_17797/g.42597  ORF Transcript_17797/g.42597 Transcript_17797/m.42597 type:complete len:263 (+) Transcript_17797:266-1054(+)
MDRLELRQLQHAGRRRGRGGAGRAERVCQRHVQVQPRGRARRGHCGHGRGFRGRGVEPLRAQRRRCHRGGAERRRRVAGAGQDDAARERGGAGRRWRVCQGRRGKSGRGHGGVECGWAGRGRSGAVGWRRSSALGRAGLCGVPRRCGERPARVQHGHVRAVHGVDAQGVGGAVPGADHGRGRVRGDGDRARLLQQHHHQRLVVGPRGQVAPAGAGRRQGGPDRARVWAHVPAAGARRGDVPHRRAPLLLGLGLGARPCVARH